MNLVFASAPVRVLVASVVAVVCHNHIRGKRVTEAQEYILAVVAQLKRGKADICVRLEDTTMGANHLLLLDYCTHTRRNIDGGLGARVLE